MPQADYALWARPLTASRRGTGRESSARCVGYQKELRPSVAQLVNESAALSCTKSTRASFVSGETHGCRDEVRVVFCAGSLPFREEEPASLINVCVPVLRGHLSTDWLRVFEAWYARLGARHFTMYSMGVHDALQLGTRSTVEVVNVDWLTGYETWQDGQLWALHDCLYRSRAAGFKWGLFVDVDELLQLPTGMDLRDLIADMERDRKAVATFGSVPYLFTRCTAASGAETMIVDRMKYRARFPECQNAMLPRDMCDGPPGRRKLLVRLHQVERLSIHSAFVARNKFWHVNASEAWLRHIRGVVSASGFCSNSDSCQAAASPPSLKAATGGAPAVYTCKQGVVGATEFFHESAL